MPILAKITQEISQVLGVERVGIWSYEDKQKAIRCIEHFERRLNRHKKGCVLEKFNDPRAREFKRYFEQLSVKSMLDVPFSILGKRGGVICIENVEEVCECTLGEQICVPSAADSISLIMSTYASQVNEYALKNKAAIIVT
ncbi:MAG: GAF domain-containing protein [Verrucomicrobiota bacterium]